MTDDFEAEKASNIAKLGQRHDKRVLVIGGSIGGLVAAAELSRQGLAVTVVEKSKSVGGLYKKTPTPFGLKEVGMHVLYVSEAHFELLCDVFGRDVFDVFTGTQVDVGANNNFGKNSFNSLYPDVREHRSAAAILCEVTAGTGRDRVASNAMDEAYRRFGAVGGGEVVAPILQKLWKTPPEQLTAHALHCFFDLRRMIVCDKPAADLLKSDPWLDEVIGNPIQTEPKGEVYGSRLGLIFKDNGASLEDRVLDWAERSGVEFAFEQDIQLSAGMLTVDGVEVHETCDACIVAIPLHSLACEQTAQLDRVELSIYYFQLQNRLGSAFPAYYLLCHDADFKSSRVVHYDAYRKDALDDPFPVIAVEAVHVRGEQPSEEEIGAEISRLFPMAVIQDSFRLERAVPVPGPTLVNQALLDSVRNSVQEPFGDVKPVYFCGMRTDTGVFFSHHTIGLAHDAALDCCKRLL